MALGIANDSAPTTPGVVLFAGGDPLAKLLAYFRQLAELDALVIPAHGVDCTPSGVDAGACTYNPMTSQLDAADIHCSSLDRGFVGPDGQPYVWVFVPDWNSYLVIDGDRACATYRLGLEYNQCSLFGP